MPTLKPLNDRIVVQAVTPETQTAGGILLPDSAQEKPQEAKVVAVGPGKTLDNGKVQTVGGFPWRSDPGFQDHCAERAQLGTPASAGYRADRPRHAAAPADRCHRLPGCGQNDGAGALGGRGVQARCLAHRG